MDQLLVNSSTELVLSLEISGASHLLQNSTMGTLEALFLDVNIGAMTPKRESKHDLIIYTNIYKYLYIYDTNI